MSSIRCDRAPVATVSLTLDGPAIEAVLRQEISVTKSIALGKIELAGDRSLASTFFAISDRFNGAFPVVDAAFLPE